jgi:hypothetical protein
MNIELHEITIREVAEKYVDNAEEGVVGYNGALNIRPKYQREFIYDEKKRNAVMDTIRKGFPLNVMYWVKNEDGTFEVMDGQQRTISFCQYVNNDFSIDNRAFHNLTETEKEQILSYKLMVYFCEGNDKEKLDWFKIINIAGMQLTAQELRNAIYTGEWLTDAKKYFSKSGCPAYQIASDYLKGSAIRQDYLETAIRWIAAKDGKEIEAYMSEHQHDTNAIEFWLYFQAVVNWVRATFPNTRKEMKGLEWGIFYNQYGSRKYDPKALELKIVELMEDEDVTRNSGVYEYLLGGDERPLNIRAFSDKMKRAAYERQNGICQGSYCGGKQFEYGEMEADHITPWRLGGKTAPENCQMLCKDCNRRKSGK